MVQGPRRTARSGPPLIRLLARLTDIELPASGQALSERLSQWLGWTDAIALSAILNGDTPAALAGQPAGAEPSEREYARVRGTLSAAIASDRVLAPAPARSRSRTSVPAAAEGPVEYLVYRERYRYLQQAMENGIGTLRTRVRTALAAATPEMARLAVLDAVMERALGARERSLLAGIAGLLETRFERLRQEAQDTPAAQAAWLDRFRQDMRDVLLAELDVRLQPVEGLLAALRASASGHHEPIPR